MMRTKNGRPLCTAHLWSDSLDVTISGNDHVQFNVMQCAWTGREASNGTWVPFLPIPFGYLCAQWSWLRCSDAVDFFPIYDRLVEPAAYYESETQITVSDHDTTQLVTFGACQKQPAVQQALVQPVRKEEFSQILSNLSKSLQVLKAMLESLQLWQGHECCRVWHASFLALKGV